ncbi:signal peptidase II [Alkaliphilus serpentinus]|uniref:Signal peptidase II n=1 Tax=Alkaliphilus serpentinus TaxID=1482731 RepID=A0A833HMF2_9FIRM|nr:signal peptidase II [Alkaliphilus serpentinus]KAB3527356.1 signal peptidase II [Alkaliphilus serpentinus]
MKIENKKTWMGVLLLVSIEQIIKIIINNNFLDKSFTLYPSFLYFDPIFNRDYSWINSMLQLGISKWLHIIMVAIIILFVFLFYRYLNTRFGSNKIVNTMFAFLFAGAISSLIDKVFWDGSLDYIYVKGFFTFDLKDVYINVFIGLMILFSILKNKVLREIDEVELIRGFGKFLKNKKCD